MTSPERTRIPPRSTLEVGIALLKLFGLIAEQVAGIRDTLEAKP